MQGIDKEEMYVNCEHCDEKILPVDKNQHQKSYKCRLTQKIEKNCYFGICHNCELDNQVLIDICEECEIKSCKQCAQNIEACPLCDEQFSCGLSYDDLLDLVPTRIDQIKARFGIILCALNFKSRQVNRLVISLTDRGNEDIKNLMKTNVLELFIMNRYTECDPIFEEVLCKYVQTIFENDDKWIIFQGVLIPMNEETERIHFASKFEALKYLQ